MAVVGTAPGKLLLVGEHGIVHGGLAFAVPFPAVEARALVEKAHGPLRLESPLWSGELSHETTGPARGLAKAALATLAWLEAPAENLKITMEATLPLGAGLGSSAATAAALVRGLLEAHGRVPGPEVDGLVHLAEIEAHGTPSGVDGRVIAMGTPIAFRRGDSLEDTRPVTTGGEFYVVVADTGVTRDTRSAVAQVGGRLQADPEAGQAILEEIKNQAAAAVVAWEEGDARALGECLDRAQTALQLLGVSTPELERLVVEAHTAGALGAKLTGAGMGGCMLALAPDAEGAARIAEALRAAGARAVWTQEYRP